MPDATLCCDFVLYSIHETWTCVWLSSAL